VIWHPSPNFGPRRNGLRPQFVVLHYTAMGVAAEALARLCDPVAEVSAHYLIDRDGTAYQMVEEDMRAWHAGAGAWAGWSDINSRSIGIELVNTGAEPFPLPQMRTLEELLGGAMARWGLQPVDVIGHSDMSPERKQDPGARFDWRALARAGLAVWPEGQGAEVDFDMSLDRIGYPPASLAGRLAAFRARFRPEGAGPLSPQDCLRAACVAAIFEKIRRSVA
jgi:N-acetylmuramoyl-L-alanine amidase